MAHPMTREGGLFDEFYEDVVGADIDFDRFDPSSFDPELLEEARGVWHKRAHTEFRSVQITTRFMSEITGAGDPIDIYAAGVDLVEDEVRHTALCAEMCRALDFQPVFPEPIRPDEPAGFLEAEMGERATHTALSMVAINEAISYGFITDLADRCDEPTVGAVLDATIADEEGHQDLGWVYLEKSLERFPASTRPQWREIVERTLQEHLDPANEILESIPSDRRRLEAWPDDERVTLGLHSDQRHALVFRQTFYEVLEPRLRDLDLLPDGIEPPPRD
jgi:hypothetical protein